MGEGTGFVTYCGGLVVWMIFWWTVSSHFPAHLTLDKFSVHTKTLQAGCGQLKECTAILCWLICTADTSFYFPSISLAFLTAELINRVCINCANISCCHYHTDFSCKQQRQIKSVRILKPKISESSRINCQSIMA